MDSPRIKEKIEKDLFQSATEQGARVSWSSAAGATFTKYQLDSEKCWSPNKNTNT
jgi:hypothetical protein